MSLLQAISLKLALGYLSFFSLVSPAQADALHNNANHIFNAIHSSMRQWGSSLNHNGMSFFVASVPAGTQLYHGRHINETITGMEWLAFEPEHALFFAAARRVPPPAASLAVMDSQTPLGSELESVTQPQDGHANDRGDDDVIEPGWLHSYNTKRDLQFLYIDGVSAGKCQLGTQDSTDYLLLDRQDWSDPIFWDFERAKALCAKVENEWGSKLAGIIRMEAGFEIIMCNFEDSVELVNQVGNYGEWRPQRWPGLQFAWRRAAADRYGGIGAGRVTLDYDRVVTAYTELDFPLETEEHRLNTTSREVLGRLRQRVADMIMDDTPDRFGGVNWQAIADMIVARYSGRLQYLLTSEVSESTSRFEEELDTLLRPFTDEVIPEEEWEAARCSRQFLTSVVPKASGSSPSLAQQAVTSVAERICQTIVDVRYSKQAPLDERVGRIRELVAYLRWTTNKECKGCKPNEICAVAAWPFGTVDEHFNPSCKNVTTAGRGRHYWNDFRAAQLPAADLQSFHGRVDEYE